MSIAELRREYVTKGLYETDLDPDPLRQLERWLDEALQAELLDATAMCLATTSADGDPNCRVVLLKQLDARGLVFFTRYSSQKGLDIAHHPKVSLLLHWRELERQVRVKGTVARVSSEESLAYFQTRPRLSQLAARAVSGQTFVADRPTLEAWFEREQAQYPAGQIPMPEDWGGYRVTPYELEFWQGRENRLHDRLLYVEEPASGWQLRRLAP